MIAKPLQYIDCRSGQHSRISKQAIRQFGRCRSGRANGEASQTVRPSNLKLTDHAIGDHGLAIDDLVTKQEQCNPCG